MTVKDLKGIVVDKVKIYEELQDCTFVDLFVGDLMDVQKDLLDREVATIGAERKNVVEILIK